MKAKDKNTDAPKVSGTFKENLKTKLTPKELADYAQTLSEKYIENVQLESDKKGVMAEYKAKIDVILGQMGLLSQKVSTQCEWRDVECHWAYNWKTDRKELVREDSGEIVKEEKISQADRQKLFPLEIKKVKRADPEDVKKKD
jgi:hypothetical protein